MEELSYDIIELPSEGKFYKNKCNRVKVYHLTLADEEILTSINLIQSGKLIDTLLDRKVKAYDENFVSPINMTIGDRVALLVYLRIGMDNFYNTNIRDTTGIYFPYSFDLTTLQLKDIKHQPDENGEFSMKVYTQENDADSKQLLNRKKSEHTIKFRLMIGKDEQNILDAQKKYANSESKINRLTLESLIMEFDGNRDKGYISKKVGSLPLLESRTILKTIEEVTPSLNFNVHIPNQSGILIETKLDIAQVEFFFPTISASDNRIC